MARYPVDKSFLAYAGMALQLAVALCVPAYLGYCADAYFSLSRAPFTLIGMLLGLIMVAVLLYVKLLKK